MAEEIFDNPTDWVAKHTGDTFAALARVASAAERAAVWERMTSEIPKYARYQARCRSELPVVIVSPT